jgi:hypothetical protein
MHKATFARANLFMSEFRANRFMGANGEFFTEAKPDRIRVKFAE